MVLRLFLSVDITSSDTNQHRSRVSRVHFKNLVKHYLKQTAGVGIVYNSEEKICFFFFFAPQRTKKKQKQRICLENNSLLKAALTGARIVYSVFGRIAAARPTSDTMLLNFIWESPISSRPSLADNNHDGDML